MCALFSWFDEYTMHSCYYHHQQHTLVDIFLFESAFSPVVLKVQTGPVDCSVWTTADIPGEKAWNRCGVWPMSNCYSELAMAWHVTRNSSPVFVNGENSESLAGRHLFRWSVLLMWTAAMLFEWESMIYHRKTSLSVVIVAYCTRTVLVSSVTAVALQINTILVDK